MSAKKLHFYTSRTRANNLRARPACGRHVNINIRTTDPSLVTCIKCLESGVFLNAVRNTVEFGTPEGAHLKEVLDRIFNAAYQAAEQAGYCETFYETMDDISYALPIGYEPPPRKRDWNISFERYYVEATTEEEALEAIKNDIRRFVRVQ